jgi:hypothetical protein
MLCCIALLSLPSTRLNAGAAAPPAAPPSAPPDGAPPLPKADSPFAVAAIFAAIPIPAAMLFCKTSAVAAATDAPPLGIARAAPCAVVATFDA